MVHRRAFSAHNPACPNPIAGYALFEALSSIPLQHKEHEVLLVDRDRSSRWARCEWNIHGYWICPDIEPGARWYVVGWRYTDGTWPTGPAHAIDVTQVDYARCPTARRHHPSLNN
jgi:hypothetical protein